MQDIYISAKMRVHQLKLNLPAVGMKKVCIALPCVYLLQSAFIYASRIFDLLCPTIELTLFNTENKTKNICSIILIFVY